MQVQVQVALHRLVAVEGIPAEVDPEVGIPVVEGIPAFLLFKYYCSIKIIRLYKIFC